MITSRQGRLIGLKSLLPWVCLVLTQCLPFESRAADGFWIMGPNLALTNQANWSFYNGPDGPEGCYMGWLFSGVTNTPGTINLNQTLQPGTYYVMLKVIDYTGGGQIEIRAGSGTTTVGTTNGDW